MDNNYPLLRAKMDALEYLAALRSAVAYAEDFELEWCQGRSKQLREIYEEAQAIFANMFKDDKF